VHVSTVRTRCDMAFELGFSEFSGPIRLGACRCMGLVGWRTSALLAWVALLRDPACAVASLGAIAPCGPPDLDYFSAMGKGNVDGIGLQHSADAAAAQRMPAAERNGVLGLTEDQVNRSAAGQRPGLRVARLARPFSRIGCRPRCHDWLPWHL
jgi:hypothetical protein